MAVEGEEQTTTTALATTVEVPQFARFMTATNSTPCRSPEIASDGYDNVPKWCGIDAQQEHEASESGER